MHTPLHVHPSNATRAALTDIASGHADVLTRTLGGEYGPVPVASVIDAQGVLRGIGAAIGWCSE